MKVRLLKRLRRKGRRQITIYSVTTTNEVTTGMSYRYSDDRYRGLFNMGDSEEDVYKKAERIYIEDYIKKQKK